MQSNSGLRGVLDAPLFPSAAWLSAELAQRNRATRLVAACSAVVLLGGVGGLAWVLSISHAPAALQLACDALMVVPCSWVAWETLQP